ncbi:hypothetical protein [Prauserella muralis]|uniref:Uncharacterized protein n=1 Tax=Prauserella muralis TaxID=588067 RepID=A0A2V4B925_9PSEU|nr:hypothetical protein [Prauserella muralis]PXY31032.1 hypothetical protein BAY60_00995 [Prauserella muralis]TWE14695.1 hypothetical protein FHX69_6853 [Prauserella muralis]
MAEEKTKEKEDSSEKKSGLRPAQVIAAGLAAVTAAFLGSSLGVYGTVLGAGLISVVTTVGSELYLRSLETTKGATKKAKALASAITEARGWQTRVKPSASVADQPTVPTARLPMPGLGAGDAEAATVYLPKPGEEPEGENGKRQWWKRRWPLILATSAVGFVIAMALVTGIEGITGKSLSGGQGVTVGRLVSGSGNTGGTEDGNQNQTPPSDEQAPSETEEPTETAPTTEEQEPTSEEQEPTETSEPTTSAPTEEAPPTQEQGAGGEAGAGAGSDSGAGAQVTPDAVP